jgi:hypothetical protein
VSGGYLRRYAAYRTYSAGARNQPQGLSRRAALLGAAAAEQSSGRQVQRPHGGEEGEEGGGGLGGGGMRYRPSEPDLAAALTASLQSLRASIAGGRGADVEHILDRLEAVEQKVQTPTRRQHHHGGDGGGFNSGDDGTPPS